MTNKKAIKRFQSWIDSGYYSLNNQDINWGDDKRALELAIKTLEEERPQGEWVVTAEDNEGVHRIQCPFCRYEKGSDFIDYIIVTFEKFPPFCESCGAELKGGSE